MTGIAVEISSRRERRYIFPCYLLTLFFAVALPQVQDGYGFDLPGGMTVYPFEVFFALTIGLFFINLIYGSKRIVVSPLFIPVMLFACVVMAWTLRGMHLYGIRSALYDARTVFYYVLFFVGVAVVKSEEDIELLLKCLLAGVVTFAMFLSSEYLLQSGPMWASRPVFMEGTSRVGAPNGLVALVALPFAILMPTAGSLRVKLGRRLIASYLVALVVILAITQSRAMLFFALLIALSATALLLRERKAIHTLKFIVLVLAAGVVLSFFMAETFVERITALSDLPTDSSYLTRILTAELALEQIANSPLFGYGYGSLMVESTRKTAGTVLDLTNYFIDWTWLTLLFKVGVVGTAVFLLMWFFAFCLAWRIRGRNAWYVGMRRSLLICLMAVFGLSIQNVFLVRGHVIVVLATLLILVDRVYRCSRSQSLA